jgi:hypothetical protein
MLLVFGCVQGSLSKKLSARGRIQTLDSVWQIQLGYLREAWRHCGENCHEPDHQ